ncbi:TPA: hypothetical protein ACXDAY_002173 [Clostridium botulinum]|uniref:hypothetical protein n=2 Tax=Clostridium botulinum TaxID=1491 RepID=UPI0004661AAA|nr:hypothetical protein [Clostridium botulinum]APH20906.1 hypothetical protein NPD1_4196 [Clostridium botulinum]APQ71206.1 hypothetical protein RSJ8_4153 [Clostridium botulinum]APR02304.1 hypothetical protein RSJ2_4016 [Clostridium botulinum]AUN01540.1 hypothetical protein RSJ19_00730 [Clostridium botulinum]MBN3352120.1 hypothetical protein [Clostridium botulinum]
MKKYKCVVHRTDEYEIEIDDKQLDEKWMKNFRECMFDFDTYEEHAEHIAQMRARFGEGFIEGYGNPLIDGEKPWFCDKDEVNETININVVSEDSPYETEVEVEEIE